MTDSKSPKQPASGVDLSHVDHALRAHASRRPQAFNRHLGSILVTIILIIGMGAAALTFYSARVTDLDRSVSESEALQAPSALPTAVADPIAALPEATKAAVGQWPATTPQSVIFKAGTATPESIESSEAAYDAVAGFATQHTAITFTITAYANTDSSAADLAQLRLEYIASQLQEDKVPKNRITQRVQQVSSYPTPSSAHTVEISRSLFDGETIPQ